MSQFISDLASEEIATKFFQKNLLKDKNVNKLKKIDEKQIHVEVYHAICKAAEEFYRLSVNIPKNLCEVTQHIHGRFDSALYHVFRCANTKDTSVKLECLHQAKHDIFFQYSSFEYLVKVHAITVGAANNVLDVLRSAYTQICKWHYAVHRVIRSSKDIG